MTKNKILKEVLERVTPPEKDMKMIEDSLKDFVAKVGKRILSLKIDAEIFVGGSFAKNTLIKKDEYDLDVFLRFGKKYEDISKITEKILKGVVNFSVIHGSRDYFRIKIGGNFFIELIPVAKVKNVKESENITDLSYSHVNYVKKKIKSKKLLDEIRIAKAFCYANKCYGAESYIRGFSGYALELLIYHYGSFLKFIREMVKVKDKLVIDIEKNYKNKREVLMDLNGSKLQSPIVLIDPTFKQRNALAALSDETFERFQDACKKFLANPSMSSFEIEKTDLDKIEKDALKKKFEFVLLEAKTDRQEGDIAGSKLLKFYNHLTYELNRFFDLKEKGFNYNGKKSARYYFVVKKKKEILVEGPSVKDVENVKAFKKVHNTYFTKKGKIYAKEIVKYSVQDFLEKWKKKNSSKVKEMGVVGLRVV